MAFIEYSILNSYFFPSSKEIFPNMDSLLIANKVFINQKYISILTLRLKMSHNACSGASP